MSRRWFALTTHVCAAAAVGPAILYAPRATAPQLTNATGSGWHATLHLDTDGPIPITIPARNRTISAGAGTSTWEF